MTDLKDLLAAERTLLAWLRTGIALMGFGFVVARFGLFIRELAMGRGGAVPQTFDGPVLGTALVTAGVVMNAWASVRHRRLITRLRQGTADVDSVGPVTVGIATALAGLLLVAALLGAATR